MALRLPPPLRQVSFEPLTDCHESHSSIDSQDEEDEYSQPRKRQKIEDLAYKYLSGQPLFILSASLKGPFDQQWVNPWRASAGLFDNVEDRDPKVKEREQHQHEKAAVEAQVRHKKVEIYPHRTNASEPSQNGRVVSSASAASASNGSSGFQSSLTRYEETLLYQEQEKLDRQRRKRIRREARIQRAMKLQNDGRGKTRESAVDLTSLSDEERKLLKALGAAHLKQALNGRDCERVTQTPTPLGQKRRDEKQVHTSNFSSQKQKQPDSISGDERHDRTNDKKAGQRIRDNKLPISSMLYASHSQPSWCRSATEPRRHSHSFTRTQSSTIPEAEEAISLSQPILQRHTTPLSTSKRKPNSSSIASGRGALSVSFFAGTHNSKEQKVDTSNSKSSPEESFKGAFKRPELSRRHVMQFSSPRDLATTPWMVDAKAHQKVDEGGSLLNKLFRGKENKTPPSGDNGYYVQAESLDMTEYIDDTGDTQPDSNVLKYPSADSKENPSPKPQKPSSAQELGFSNVSSKPSKTTGTTDSVFAPLRTSSMLPDRQDSKAYNYTESENTQAFSTQAAILMAHNEFKAEIDSPLHHNLSALSPRKSIRAHGNIAHRQSPLENQAICDDPDQGFTTSDASPVKPGPSDRHTLAAESPPLNTQELVDTASPFFFSTVKKRQQTYSAKRERQKFAASPVLHVAPSNAGDQSSGPPENQEWLKKLGLNLDMDTSPEPSQHGEEGEAGDIKDANTAISALGASPRPRFRHITTPVQQTSRVAILTQESNEKKKQYSPMPFFSITPEGNLKETSSYEQEGQGHLLEDLSPAIDEVGSFLESWNVDSALKETSKNVKEKKPAPFLSKAILSASALESGAEGSQVEVKQWTAINAPSATSSPEKALNSLRDPLQNMDAEAAKYPKSNNIGRRSSRGKSVRLNSPQRTSVDKRQRQKSSI
ncbi:hypothetical protein L228DRAFT_271252 [Xylona heveae TC161]|uniref:Uncharacterized protein n=1 Tax=Xylona heveae (strain CBS 132557 / TC161) TaxID=1328760 RepID=A0A164ZSB5_XYLHT|nr:hypothetical protein L228DRAFT_271252 [Xylona heveae TC161]KZF19450.1 hypothetical protein L228DRAFT_271252 [Xylona heveae TC161]